MFLNGENEEIKKREIGNRRRGDEDTERECEAVSSHVLERSNLFFRVVKLKLLSCGYLAKKDNEMHRSDGR